MPWLDNWSKRRKMTIDGTKVNESLTDFPIMISLASGTGRTNADVTDIFDELTVTNSGIVDSYTKFLLHTEGDASSYTKTITINGNPVQYPTTGKFSGSIAFDGSDYLSAGTSADWTFGTSDFTVDFWMYASVASTGRDGVVCFQNNTSDIEVHIGLGGSATDWASNGNNICLSINYNGSSWGQQIKGTTDVCNSVWHHVAVVVSSGVYYVYVDGVQDASVSYSFSVASNTLVVGAATAGDRYFAGSIDELRVSTGIARWTTAFALPTSPYTATSGIDSYTKLMLHFDSDKGVTGHNITFNGDMDLNPSIYKFRDANNGYGSYYFDGTGDYITIPDHEDWNFGSSNFTVDFWFYPTAASRGGLFGPNGWWLGLDFHQQGTRNVNMWASSNGTSWDIMNADGGGNGIGHTSLALNQWHHVAFTRNGSLWRLYLNGVLETSVTSSATLFNSSAALLIGAWYPPTYAYYFTGYISEFRISKGIARWTTNFTPPTVPYPDYRDVYSYTPKKIALATVTSSGSNQLYGEIEEWNPYDKKAVLWTKYPALSSGVSSELYLYYDKNKPDNTSYVEYSDTATSQNVWSPTYSGVWHMAQYPVGSSSILDSTAKMHYMSPNGTMTPCDLIIGKIDGAIALDGSNDYLSTPDSADWYLSNGDFTINFWIRFNTLASNMGIMSQCADAGNMWAIMWSSTLGIYFACNSGGGTLVGFNQGSVGGWSVGVWYQVSVVRIGSSWNIYRNGVSVASTTSAISIPDFATTFIIGYLAGWSYFSGDISDVEFCKGTGFTITKTLTNYYNQGNDFLTFSSSESGPPAHAFSGHVYEYAVPVSRTVRAYNRITGQLMDSNVSDPSTGYYYLTTTVSGPHYIVCLDGEATPSFNDLIIGQAEPEVV